MNDKGSIAIGCSVTRRIKNVKQPRGGYIAPKEFSQIQLDGGTIDDLAEENVSPGRVGTAVDYMTRFMSGTSAPEAFAVSRRGAMLVSLLYPDAIVQFDELLSHINGLDDESIRSAIKLVGFDAAFRAGLPVYKPAKEIEPDAATISNVRIMVERSLRFFETYGPKIMDGLTFEGGYTDTVSSGDGDFMTADTLWDFKVSKNRITSQQTLQLLMYWRMGLHSTHDEYKNVRYLGIYNPRMNAVYQLDVSMLDQAMIAEVEHEIIGYK